MAPEPDDHLDELRARLRETQEAAERIAGRVPPQGWATAAERDATAGEVQALVSVLHALRDLVPEDLWEQVRELLRRLLLLLRAILDLVVDRLAADRAARAPRAPGPDLQDIPIA
jgi:fermentation-respiration switch protein FrsA (DUF1100 family)